jgi:hypothetical protein
MHEALNVNWNEVSKPPRKPLLADFWVQDSATAAADILSNLSATERAKVLEILRAAQDEGNDPAQIEEKINEQVPRARGLGRLLNPEVGVAAILVTALLTLVIALLAAWSLSTTHETVQHEIVVQHETVIVPPSEPTTGQATSTQATTKPAAVQKPKRPRLYPNDLCWCESGSRYRHCHGNRRK